MAHDPTHQLPEDPTLVGLLAMNPPKRAEAATVKLRTELLSVGTVVVAFVLTIITVFMNGVEGYSYKSTAFNAETTGILLSDCNTSIVSLVGIPVDYMLDSFVSVFFKVFASNRYSRTDQSFWLETAFFIASGGSRCSGPAVASES